MNESLAQLTKYVNCATDLAEALQRDLKNGTKISDDTVMKLAKFISAANAAGHLLDNVLETDVKLQ